MARTTTALRDVVLNEGGFDSTLWSTAAVGWLNEAQKEMVADARWKYADDFVVGTTVAAQQAYTLSESAVNIAWIEVGGVRYDPTTSAHMDALHERIEFSVPSTHGWFSEAANATGATKQIRLYPAPTVTGTAITAKASLIPADLDTTTSNPVIPEDLEGALIAGAIGKGKVRVEQRGDAAAPYKAEFQEGVEKLRRRRKSRFGSGAVRIPVKGYSFR